MTCFSPPVFDKDKQDAVILAMPTGSSLGLSFSNSLPCEINLIKENSPIIDEGIACLGRSVFRFSVPNTVDIRGSIKRDALIDCLKLYSNVPNRMIEFKTKGDQFLNQGGLVTTTTLPTGPIDVKFKTSKGNLNNHGRVTVARVSPTKSHEYPLRHFVEKLIVPNRVVIEGIHKRGRLLQALKHFSYVPGRTLVFQKRSTDVPYVGIRTKINLPAGAIGVIFDEEYRLPVVADVLSNTSGDKLDIPMRYFIESLEIPDKITIHRMECISFEQVLNRFSRVADRILVLQKYDIDIPNLGATVKLFLQTGYSGVEFVDSNGWPTVSKSSSCNYPIIGFYVERLLIPGKIELMGMDITTLSSTLEQYSDVSQRILVLKEFKKDICKMKEKLVDQNHEMI